MKRATLERNQRRAARPSLRERAIELVRNAFDTASPDIPYRQLLTAARALIDEAHRIEPAERTT